MEELSNQLITTLVGLALLAGGYLLWLLTGVVNSVINTKVWSWKKCLADVSKAVLMGVTLLGLVILSNGLDWYAGLLGFDVTEFTDGLSTVTMLGGIVAGIAVYYGRAMKNALNFFKLTTTASRTKEEVDYAGVANDVKEFIDTIIPKKAKDVFEEALQNGEEDVVELLDYEEVEGGKGGVANTYPNTPKPYKTAAVDTITDPSTCYNRECVSYCAWKICEVTGKWPTRTGGMNARYWVQRLAENGYTKVVDRPQNGGKYVGVTDKGEYGHVVWFEEGTTISEYNYLYRGDFSVRNIDTTAYKWVEIKAPATVVAPAAADNKPTKKDPTVYYTYKQGDTFGQVITDLGLKTSHGLWGSDGDVAYYTNQLREQGITGNIPVNAVIKLTPRK